MRRKLSFGQIAIIVFAAGSVAGFIPLDRPAIPRISLKTQAIDLPASQTPVSPSPVVPDTPEQKPPLSASEQKAADERLIFNRALVDAAVLLTEMDGYRRGKSKKVISISAFRSLEIRLNEIADKDPANAQARDMAGAMKMAQFQLLQPSVAVAAAADRQLYVNNISRKLQSQGVVVSFAGADSSSVQLTSPQMTRETGRRIAESEKIPEQARRLEFKTMIFSNGKRKWRYVLARGAKLSQADQ